MAFHVPFNQRASAQSQAVPVYIGFDFPQRPRKKFNWWGFNGMWMSFASLLTAGFFSPVPLLVSLIGLRRPGKKMATVGTLVSFVGIAIASTCSLGLIAAHNHRQDKIQNRVVKRQVAETEHLLEIAAVEILEYRVLNDGKLPSDLDGSTLVVEHEDAWGESLRFEPEDDRGVIRSSGPDKEFYTSDDLTFDVDGETDTQPLLPVDQ